MVQQQFQPALEAEAKHVLGEPERGAWFEYAADPTSGSPNLLFHYPSHQPTGFDYLPRAVKLEFGSLTDQQPVGLACLGNADPGDMKVYCPTGNEPFDDDETTEEAPSRDARPRPAS